MRPSLNRLSRAIQAFVTVGYDSPAIREFEYQAKAAGITVLNEVGINPGVYHLYAIKDICEVHEKDGRYDFSWPSCVVLVSLQNFATCFQDGKVIEISNKDLISRAVLYNLLDEYSFSAYPNRDYVLFRQAYFILETHTVI
ncbi:hypothetical protein LB503_008118 [Fusarium chuoi]|nr:hypothetical protein LB503_008118 [Fusarium chuoi]